MSLFKIVGNYYEDTLDYYTREFKKLDPAYDPVVMEKEFLKFQDNPTKSPILSKFKERFMSIFEIPSDKISKKVEIMKLLAMTYMKLDRVRESDSSYWAARARTYSNLRIIIFVMTLVVGYFVLVYLRKYSVEGMTDKTVILQSNIAYFTIFTVIFTVFLLFGINLGESIKMSKERGSSNLNKFNDFNLLLVPNIQFQQFFTGLGYLTVNNTSLANKFFKKVSGPPSIKTDNDQCGPTTQSKISMYVLNKDPCKSKANLDEIYNDLKREVSEYTFQFYNYGHGYTTLRKQVVKSTSRYMLKEVRNVMTFYYYLVNKKGDYDTERSVIESNKKMLDKILISKLQSMKLSYFLDSSSTSASSLMDVTIAENEDVTKNPQFAGAMAVLQNSIMYLAVFLSPLYHRESPTSETFSTKTEYNYLPQNIKDEDKQASQIQTKTYFTNKATQRYNEMLMKVEGSSPQDFNVLFADIILEYEDYIAKYVNEVILVMKGNNMFILDDAYISKKWDEYVKTTPLAQMDKTYITVFKEAFTKVLFPRVREGVYAKFDMNGTLPTVNSIIAFKESLVIDVLADELSNYNINVRENTPYILDKIIKNTSGVVDEKLLIIYKNILVKLDQNIEMKKRMKRSNEKVDQRFVTASEFTDRIGDISFNDVHQGLKTQYMYEILNDFYMEVSGAIGTSENTGNPVNRTEHNIFYKKQRGFKLARWTIFMVCIIIALVFIYFLIGWIQGLRNIEYEKSLLDPDAPNYKQLKYVVRTKKVNHWIKMLILFSISVFFMAMLYSYYKKAIDAFEFNKDTIETNTSDLLDVIMKLDTHMSVLKQSVGDNGYMRISDHMTINEEGKAEMFKGIVELIDKYEKCNYIINISQSYIPFPYTEITVDAFMIGASLLSFLYVYGQMSPLSRLQKIKKLNKMGEDVAFMSDAEMTKLVDLEKACNDEEIDIISFTLKIIIFSFVFMFLIFYTVTIISSTGEFKNGLYNSSFFEESQCYSG